MVVNLERHRVGNMCLLHSDFGTGMLLDSVHPAFGPSELYQTQEAYEMCHAIFGSTKFEDIQGSPDTKLRKEKVYEVLGAKEEDCKVPATEVPAEVPPAEDPNAEIPATDVPLAEVPTTEVPAEFPVEVPAECAETSTKASEAVGEKL